MNKLIIVIFLTLFMGCIRGGGERKINMSPLQKYLSYSVDSVFNSKQYLKDISGQWVCYAYERDNEYYPNFEEDEAFNKEFSKYFYFEIINDTIKFSIYKMPIKCEKFELTKCNKVAQERFNYLLSKDSCNSTLSFAYTIRGVNKMYYEEYQEKMMDKGDTLPSFEDCSLGIKMWCFPNYIAIQTYGCYWYFKKGISIKKGIQGMPSNNTSRFTVNRTYTNCTIKEAVYKLIEDFPKGTVRLLAFSDEPNEKGDIETWFPDTSGFNYGESTQYIWHNDSSVTVRVHKTKNSTFVFEFNKEGKDVHAKYWNDVVFPFEKGYKSEN